MVSVRSLGCHWVPFVSVSGFSTLFLPLSQRVSRPRGALLPALICLLALFAAWSLPVKAQQQPVAQTTEVGEVTLHIGQAQVERGGKGITVSRGMKVQVGDVLRTTDSGHVHIRFVDGAMVSLRPASQMEINAYRFNADNPAESAVKFTLVSGAVRSISGKAAEAARERFRLNTPFVAIGVRGTDFVTRVDGPRVAASVNQGAIVFSPLDAACRADALGPCSGDRSRLLTADMRSMVEFARNQSAPVVRPVEAANGREIAVPVPPDEASNVLKRNRNELDAQTRVASQIETRAAPYSGPAAEAPLVWGRWTGMALFGDVEVLHFLDALKGRNGAIGTENFSLFRYEPSPLRFDTASGSHDFRISQASANFVPVNGDSALAAYVLRGSLNVNFAARSFSTSLDLQSSTGLRASVLGSGGVDDRGIFLMDATDTRVRGAVGRNADTAGLVFERTLQGVGRFNGVTLWGK